MNMMDYRDQQDAQRAIRRAQEHGDSDGILAFRDRLDAAVAMKQAGYEGKLGDLMRVIDLLPHSK